MENLRNLLKPHNVVLMPKELKLQKTKHLIIGILITTILDLVSMSVKAATFAIERRWIYLGLFFLVLYYLRQSLTDYTKVFLDAQNIRIDAKSKRYIHTNTIKISNSVRGKVYSKTDNGSSEIMQNSEIMLQIENYIRTVWDFWNTLPTTLADIVILITLSISMIYMEWISSNDLKVTFALTLLLVICTLFYVFFSKLRLQVRSFFRSTFQKFRKKSEKIKDTLKVIEPICEEEANYRANSFLEAEEKLINSDIEQTKKFNYIHVFRSLIIATYMCIILIIKIYSSGGINNISTATIAEVVALGTIYQTILEKFASILKYIESIVNNFRDLEGYSKDFCNIIYTYDKLCNFNKITCDVDKITVNPLIAEYPKKESAYRLEVKKPFVLEKGKCYLFAGPTGCGKSTLIHLICGKILLTPSPVSYGENLERGYLSSLLHETNSKLGTEFVLNEIIFSNDLKTLNKEKLITILKGLNLYDDFRKNLGIKEDNLETEEKIINYLASTNIEEYSAGQKQRLSLAKLLYNLKDYHQIISFDEATNALDSKTTIKVLKFIKKYCMEDKKRILIFASHQIEEVKTIVDEGFTFSQEDFPTSKLVKMDLSNI